MSAYDDLIAALEQRGSRVDHLGDDRAMAQCPAHDDHNPSLSLRAFPEKAGAFCMAGCTTPDVMATLGLSMADLYDDRGQSYTYDDGRVVKRSYRKDGKKTFRQSIPAGTTPKLYRAARIAAAPPGTLIFLVEGESDVHTLEYLGEYATTAPQGGRNFHKVDDFEPLRNRNVIAIADRDATGKAWIGQVRQALIGVAATLQFFHARQGKDVTDHITAGFTLDDLVEFEPEPSIIDQRENASLLLDGAAMDRPAPPEFPPDDPDAEPPDSSHVVLRKASTIAMKGVRWLYRGRIPAGMVTLLAGREGIGKSTVALDLAARLTQGTLDGRYEGRPQSIAVCATEDSWEHTIVPRLRAVGADLDRVFHIAVQDDDGAERAIVAPQDTRRMEKAFLTLRPALMLIDPLMAVLDGKVDTHKQAEVQQALEPIVRMCNRLDMSILALIHVNKSNGTDPLNNIMGSKAFATLPRSVLYCIEEDSGEFMFCHVKCNVGPKMPSIRYRLAAVRFDLDPAEVESCDEPYIESSRVVWGEMDERSAADVLEELNHSDRPKGALRKTLLEWLGRQAGGVALGEIVKEFADEKENTIRQTLRRMEKAGEVIQPGGTRGIYAAAVRS